jgi:hypothetical protein
LKPPIFLIHPLLPLSKFNHVDGQLLQASWQQLIHQWGQGPARLVL